MNTVTQTLSYNVERIGDEVFYTIFRGEDEVTKRRVTLYDFTLFKAVFVYNEGSEACITYQLKLANRLAKKAMESMLEYEELL